MYMTSLKAHPTTSPPSSETPTGICHVCLRGGRSAAPVFLIQEGRPRSWSYRKQGLHGPEMGARRWGKRA